MDETRRRLLTECIDFFQENLKVTNPLVHRCVEEGIFTMEEGKLIWVSFYNITL